MVTMESRCLRGNIDHCAPGLIVMRAVTVARYGNHSNNSNSSEYPMAFQTATEREQGCALPEMPYCNPLAYFSTHTLILVM